MEDNAQHRRWMNTKQAADYCGYGSADHFRREAAEYQVPKYGPHSNKFDRFDLDAWMQSPRCFLNKDAAKSTTRKIGSYAIVHDALHEVLKKRKEHALI